MLVVFQLEMSKMPKFVTCPFCRKRSKWRDNPWRPFCSKRCKMIDLGLWAKGEYRIPGERVSKESVEEKEEEINSKHQIPNHK